VSFRAAYIGWRSGLGALLRRLSTTRFCILTRLKGCRAAAPLLAFLRLDVPADPGPSGSSPAVVRQAVHVASSSMWSCCWRRSRT
jgi:hypothetical protein